VSSSLLKSAEQALVGGQNRLKSLLNLISGSLYWVLVSNLEREDNQFMADEIYVLRTILKERPNDLGALREKVEWEVAARRFEKYCMRILNEQGHVLIETPGMEAIAAPSLFPESIEADKMPERGEKRKGHVGRPLLLMAVWEVGDSGAQIFLHQVVLDISYETAILSNYRRNMAILLFLGTIISAAFSGAILIPHLLDCPRA